MTDPPTKIEQFNQMVRGLVTLGLVAAFLFMCIRGISVPEAMLTILSVVITFWFTSRARMASVAAGVAAAVAAKNGKDTLPASPPTPPAPPSA